MKYVSIDIETTGIDPNKHQMIEFGAVIEDTENMIDLDKLPTFRALIQHNDYVVNPYCLTLHTELYKEICSHKENIYTKDFVVLKDGKLLGGAFANWLGLNGIDVDKKLNVAGKNFNGFDKLFLSKYMDGLVKFSHRALDPVALFVELNDVNPPNLAECAKRAGIEFTGKGYHTAVSDALMVVELLRKGWK